MLCRLVFAGIFALAGCIPSRATDAPQPLVKIAPDMDLSGFKNNNVSLTVTQDVGSSVLSMQAKANAAFPGFHVTPPGGNWDLSAAKGVQAVITNPGPDIVYVTLRAENAPGPGQKDTWSLASVGIGAGETRTVQAEFGKQYGNPGFALDPAKINGLTLYLGGDASPAARTVLVRSIDTFTQVQIQPPPDFGKPPGDGLVLWLDPSKDTTVTADAAGAVSAITDRTGGNHDAKAATTGDPLTLSANDGKHRPMLHFTGQQSLAVSAIRPAAGGVTVFVVYTKLVGKQTAGPNPALFVSRPDETKAPDALPNFVIPGPDAKAPWKLTQPLAVDNAPIGPITIGQDFSGMIGEVLVYDHTFTAEGDRRKVLEYLQAKWGVPYPEPGWVREGPLDPAPARTRDDLPLSDQANTGNWTLDPAFTDEFKGTSIDATRWHLFHTAPDDWWGRQPGLFLTQNVTEHDGALHIKLDKGTPDELKGHGGYGYTTGYIRTNDRTFYGYYEITARPGKSEMDNAFWLADTGDPNNGLEIDIFEQGPHAKGYSNTYFMTAHVWGENGDKRHWGSMQTYTLPWNAADDFHTYGLEWTKDDLIWYIDGSVVRKLKNTNWHRPMRMIFDVEPMLQWFGPIDDKDFPTEYTIKDFRVWRQPGYTPPAPPPAPPAKTPAP